MMRNKHSLRWKVFNYLIILTLLIFIFIWLFQIIFLNYNYESYKTKELTTLVNELKNKNAVNDELYSLLETYSFEKGICSEVITKSIVTYTTNYQNRSCLNIYKKNAEFQKIENKFLTSNEDTFMIKLDNPLNKAKTLIYGIKLNDEISILSNTSVDPIDSTVTVLKNQLIVITIITFIISSIVAFFLANKLSKPIISITNKSKGLSKSNFDIDFNVNSDIIEIDDLSKALNYTKDILKKNDEIRRDLMANVSHDLKTPLTMIKAYAEKIKDFSYKDSIKRDNDLNIIIEEVDRLNLLVNDILSLSKLEANIEETIKEEFDLVKMIETIINRFKIFSITQDYEFTFLSPKEVLIKADKQKMEQVIYNLIGNALNYSENKKKIYITIIVRDKVRVGISDTGKGINKEEINSIWDKYYKAKKNHKRNTVGTGLGLSIVKNIFELHNYKFGVISKKNKGTTFYFIINNIIR